MDKAQTHYQGSTHDAPWEALGRSEPGFARALTMYDARGNETVLNHVVGRDHVMEWERDTRVKGRMLTRALARSRARIYAYFAAYGELPGTPTLMEYEI